MLEALAMYSDELMERMLSEEPVSEQLIHHVVKHAVQEQDMTPVFLGTAFRNKGVQKLLDAVVRYLPSPLERQISAKKWDNPEEKMPLSADPTKPFVGMTFKVVDDPYGQLTFTRVYQGTVRKGRDLLQPAHRPKAAFQPHREDARRQARRNRQCRGRRHRGHHGRRLPPAAIRTPAKPKYCSLENMFVAGAGHQDGHQPGQSRRRGPARQGAATLHAEDPTFRVNTDEETSETLIAGMGELHLEIYVERIRREYKVDVEVGAPKVSYREAPTATAQYNYKHKKQTGGSGQYAHIVGRFEVLGESTEEEPNDGIYEFENDVVQGRIPREYIPSVDKGFKDSLSKGPIAGYPIVGVKCILEDGSYHDVDSSDMAFQVCARGCFRETFMKAKPVLLEPIMKLEVEVPTQFQGAVAGELTSRRGMIVSTEIQGAYGDYRRRSAAGRDVRLLHRPAQHDARAGHVHDGVCQVRPRPQLDPARDHQREEKAARGGEVGFGNRGVIHSPRCISTRPLPRTMIGRATNSPKHWPHRRLRLWCGFSYWIST